MTDWLVSRMRPHRATIFGEMSVLATELGAINLGQGFPDTDGPESVREAAVRAIREGRGNQYPPVHGVPQLREAIASHQHHWYGLSPDPATEVVVTTGASEAIPAVILALVERGEEVVLFDPHFDIYPAAIALADGVCRPVSVLPGTLRPDIDALRHAVTSRTRLLVVNSPNNPTGIVYTPAELAAIAEIAEETDTQVISDEVYEHLWFDGHRHTSFATLPGMAERTLTIGSAGKCFSLTGWKVGWVTGPADLIGAVRTVRQHMSFVSGGPFQYAIAEGLALPDEHWESERRSLQARRDHFTAGLRTLGFGVIESEGSYFLSTDVRPLGFTDGRRFCHALAHSAGVVAIPEQALCHDEQHGAPYVRWALCKRREVLDEALDRMAAALPGLHRDVWEPARVAPPEP